MDNKNSKKAYYIVWYTDNDGQKDYETYSIIQAENIKAAWKMAEEMFGDYVIDVNPYNP